MRRVKLTWFVLPFLLLSVALLGSCSSEKYIPTGSYLLDKIEITSDRSSVNAASLAPYIRQKANSKWFSIFKVPLGAYTLSGRDTTKWINRTLKRIGESPVVYDSVQAKLSCRDLTLAMNNLGYMHASTQLVTTFKKRSVKAHYILHPGEPYLLGKVTYNVTDSTIARVLGITDGTFKPALKEGQTFNVAALQQERERITQLLLRNGYYRFHRDYIQFRADSSANNRKVNLTLELLPYRVNADSAATVHPRYIIDRVNVTSNDSSAVPLRPSVINYNLAIQPGHYFNSKQLQTTYNNFARLQAIRYTNITFDELPDSNRLVCNVQLSPTKPNSLSFQPEGTNTAGDLGAAASLTYQNRNLFHGSEVLSLQLRGAFEAITGLEGYQNQNFEEYGVEGSVQFPRFIAPFLSQGFRRKSKATSELAVSWDLQNRPEFHRRVFSAGWRYKWSDVKHNTNYRLDLIDVNYVYMPWISSTFKKLYLDSVSNRNAILKFNYEDLLIMRMGFGFTYNNGVNVWRANIETAGNLLNAFSAMGALPENSNSQHTFLNIAYAQYAKFDMDYTHLFHFDAHNTLALHTGFGVAYPYGNTKILPFEKRYFAGGPNSVRGWSVRGLGPGSFKGTDGRIDFINQTGDIKLDLNAEMRTYLFWKFNGAVFVDAGNIWTIRNYADQPGGQFKFDKFYKQLAVSYGVGLRLNFDYFILRFDLGIRAVDPAYETTREHYPIFHPQWSRDANFHFAVGLPF